MVRGWIVVGWKLLAEVEPAQTEDRGLHPICGCTPVEGCTTVEAAMLHTPYASLRPAVGNCCRRIWRLGRSGGKADSSRRGGLEVLEVCQAEASNVQVNCCLRRRGDERERCGGEQPKEDGKESRVCQAVEYSTPGKGCSRGVHTNGSCGGPD